MAGYTSAILAETSLVSFWPLAETSGTSAADAKGTNTGTYTGGYTLGQLPPYVQVSGAVNFNGSTGYVNVPTASNISPTAAVSVECWCKLNNAPGSSGT